MTKRKVYLSGPDRLKKNARDLKKKKKKLCEKYGFILTDYPEDLFELKGTLEENRTLAEKRLQMIEDCDVFIADVNDFRAYVEPFGETALEMTGACAFRLNGKSGSKSLTDKKYTTYQESKSVKNPTLTVES